MKSGIVGLLSIIFGSHPARGAWIEMSSILCVSSEMRSRTPQGVRGLKCIIIAYTSVFKASHPARGAWIEIRYSPRMFA